MYLINVECNVFDVFKCIVHKDSPLKHANVQWVSLDFQSFPSNVWFPGPSGCIPKALCQWDQRIRSDRNQPQSVLSLPSKHAQCWYCVDFRAIEKREKKLDYFHAQWFTLRTCQWMTGRRGFSTISFQCFNSAPLRLYPRDTLPMGSDVPIRS